MSLASQVFGVGGSQCPGGRVGVDGKRDFGAGFKDSAGERFVEGVEERARGDYEEKIIRFSVRFASAVGEYIWIGFPM